MTTPNPYEGTQQPPAYSTPGQPEWFTPPPPQPPKKKRKGWWIAGGVLAALIVIGALTDNEEDPTPASTPETSAPAPATATESEEPEDSAPEPSQAATGEPTQAPDPQPVEDPVDTAPEPEPEPERDPFTGDLTYEESTLVMDMTWDGMSAQDVEATCAAYQWLGSDEAYSEFSAGFGDEMTVDRQAFDDSFEEYC